MAAAAWPFSMPSKRRVTTRWSAGPSIGSLQRVRAAWPRRYRRLLCALIAPGVGAPRSRLAGPLPRDSSAAPGASLGRTQLSSASYAECRRVAREAASNFYYAFYMLPRPKRDALCALYAFMRLVDDVSDDDASAATSRPAESGGDAGRRSGRWRALLDQAVAGETARHPILPAFADTIRRYRIPPRYFHDLISGAEMDLTETRYATFERLQEYCYRVAGTVGLTCLHVFGFGRSSRAGTGRAAGHRLPADQYSARCRRRSGDGPRLSAGGRPDALRMLGGRSGARGGDAAGARTAALARPNAPGVSMPKGRS